MPSHTAVLRRAARRALAVATLLVAAAGAARAQVAVTYTGPTTDAWAFPFQRSGATWAYSVGPVSETFTAGLPGQASTVTAFCVDFANEITRNTSYTANVTSLGAVLAGQGTLAGARQTAPGALAGYQKAAYLIDQFQPMKDLTGAARNTMWGALQGALWSIFTPNAVALDVGTSTTNPGVIEYWQQQANTFAASAAFSTYDYTRFYIVTDARAADAGGAGVKTGGVQEFMFAGNAYTPPTVSTVTPEPGTVLLLGLGLTAAAGIAARRRRTGEA